MLVTQPRHPQQPQTVLLLPHGHLCSELPEIAWRNHA